MLEVKHKCNYSTSLVLKVQLLKWLRFGHLSTSTVLQGVLEVTDPTNSNFGLIS